MATCNLLNASGSAKAVGLSTPVMGTYVSAALPRRTRNTCNHVFASELCLSKRRSSVPWLRWGPYCSYLSLSLSLAPLLSPSPCFHLLSLGFSGCHAQEPDYPRCVPGRFYRSWSDLVFFLPFSPPCPCMKYPSAPLFMMCP